MVAAPRGLTGGVENPDSGKAPWMLRGAGVFLEEFLTDLKRGPVGARDPGHRWRGNATGRFHDFTIRQQVTTLWLDATMRQDTGMNPSVLDSIARARRGRDDDEDRSPRGHL